MKKKCINCKSEMESAGIFRFKAEKFTGSAILLGLVLGEKVATFRVYVCPKCKKVELYLPEKEKEEISEEELDKWEKEWLKARR